MANSHSLDLEASSSQYASITDASQTGLDLNSDFTFEVWFKLESLPSTAGNPYKIIDKDDGTNRSYSLQIHHSYPVANSLLLNYFDSSGSNKSNIVEGIVDSGDVGSWVHIACSVDLSASTCVVYKNSVSQSVDVSGTNNGTIKNTNTDFVIGARYGGIAHYFDGLIDEVRVWDDIRTSTEITDNKDKELIGTEANLQGYWKFNNDYTDETSNGNDLTASGSPVFSTDVPFVGETPPTASPIAHILQMI